MPGQGAGAHGRGAAVLASTKGPGVMPGQWRLADVWRDYIGLNEGTGRYARSVRRPPLCNRKECRLNEGTGRYARSDLGVDAIVRRRLASTKGPGVMPGQGCAPTSSALGLSPQRRDRALCPVSCHLRALVREHLASTKGPGVMPGQRDGEGGAVRDHDASTKGPGVMPGQHPAQGVGRELRGASTKGPGVMPGQGSATVRVEPDTVGLNEGTGSYARSDAHDRVHRLAAAASTQGPGVRPGQFESCRVR